MRMMVDLGSQNGPLRVIENATSVECGREMRYRRSFRSLVECVVPCCGMFQDTSDSSDDNESIHSSITTTNTVTGTFFGYRKGRVSFCLQHHARGDPLLLLELAVPTSYLAREMQHGVLRIALECDKKREHHARGGTCGGAWGLFDVPVWTLYCNGRKVRFAIRRQMTEEDAAVLRLMRTVSAGAGVLPVETKAEESGDLMYLRASFERVIGSADSESFHMINPVGSSGQELSIFFLRS